MRLPSILILLMLSSQAFSGDDEILFNGYRISRTETLAPDGTALTSPSQEASDTSLGFVQSDGPISQEWKSNLSSKGIVLIGYAYPRAYMVKLPSKPVGIPDESLGGVFLPILPEMKAESTVFNPKGNDPVPLIVHVAGKAAVETTANIVVAGGGEPAGVKRGKNPRIGLRVTKENLRRLVETLAQSDDVYYIERDRGTRLFNDAANPILQSGTNVGSNTVWDHGIYGEGEIVAVLDTGADVDSCFLRDPSGTLPPANTYSGTVVEATRRKVIAVNFLLSSDNPLNPIETDDPNNPSDWDSAGHGTSVAGCAAGGNVNDPTGAGVKNGIAPLAKLVIQDGGDAVDDCSDLPALGCPVIDLTPIFQQVYDQGARIENCSWGDRENFFPQNLYTSRCADVDDFTRENPDFLCIFAAGNSGETPGSLSSPSTAKNAVSAGATQTGSSYGLMADFSSHGPVNDGRIKPDLCAPGTAVTARSDFSVATDNCDIRTGSGTSFSSPFTAGAAALLREYIRKGFYPDGSPNPDDSIPNPSAALIKAMLIASTVDTPGAVMRPPGNDQGWGRVLLDNVMFFTGDERHLYISDNQAGFSNSSDPPFEVFLSVTEGTPLKIVLVWSDYPGTPGVIPNLVNDLDLRVDAGSEIYWGNNLLDGDSIPNGSPDNINNVEVVWIESPMTRTYHVAVQPASLPESPQGFALVATGNLTPTGSSSIPYWDLY